MKKMGRERKTKKRERERKTKKRNHLHLPGPTNQDSVLT